MSCWMTTWHDSQPVAAAGERCSGACRSNNKQVRCSSTDTVYLGRLRGGVAQQRSLESTADMASQSERDEGC